MSTYSGDQFSDLNVNTPVGNSDPVADVDDAIQQIKRYLKNTLGQPDISGTIFDAILTESERINLPVGSIIPYTATEPFTAPDLYLKCGGDAGVAETIGNATSGATYRDNDFQELFNLLKPYYGNEGTEDWASGDTVKLPLLEPTPLGINEFVNSVTLSSPVQTGIVSSKSQPYGVSEGALDSTVNYGYARTIASPAQVLVYNKADLLTDSGLDNITHVKLVFAFGLAGSGGSIGHNIDGWSFSNGTKYLGSMSPQRVPVPYGQTPIVTPVYAFWLDVRAFDDLEEFSARLFVEPISADTNNYSRYGITEVAGYTYNQYLNFLIKAKS
jgi:hypothetical protein